MPIPLTLGVRPGGRDPRALLTGLLWPTAPDGLDSAHVALGRPVHRLDPTADPSATPVEVTAVLDLAGSGHAVSTPALMSARADIPAQRVVLFGADAGVEELIAAGYVPGLDAAPADPDPRPDVIAAMAHQSGGYVTRATTPAQVLSILAATVAALRGDYVRDALATPDVRALARLHPDAAAATREVLLGVVVPPGVDVGALAAELDRALGATD